MNEKKTDKRKTVWDNFHLITIFPCLDNDVEKMVGLQLQRILEEIDYQVVQSMGQHWLLLLMACCK